MTAGSLTRPDLSSCRENRMAIADQTGHQRTGGASFCSAP